MRGGTRFFGGLTVTVQQQKANTGCVFNIQHYSVHDGPGIRTIVFFKGCPLSCRWCSNPESQKKAPEIAYNPNKCIGADDCFRCGTACQSGAIAREDNGKIAINREKCTECFLCVEACPSKAMHIFGSRMGVDEIIKTVERDSAFYSRSGGGLTVSGGEPLTQAGFVVELLKEAKRRRINTAMETCGCADWDSLEAACRYLDTILFDIKTVDPVKHKEYTGAGNEMILDNLINIRNAFPKLDILVRTPLSPSFNDTEEDVAGIVDFIRDIPDVRYELLPYHRMGLSKYQFLGREYPMGDIKLDEKKAQELKEFAMRRLGSKCASVFVESIQRRISPCE